MAEQGKQKAQPNQRKDLMEDKHDQSNYETSYGNWDQIDYAPSDAYANSGQAYFDLNPFSAGAYDVGEDYPRGV